MPPFTGGFFFCYPIPMTLLTTDILALMIALVASSGLMLWAFRANYYFRKENLELREQLLRYTKTRSKKSE
jgi:hypothetical protein